MSTGNAREREGRKETVYVLGIQIYCVEGMGRAGKREIGG